jgi:hypothetical protein
MTIVNIASISNMSSFPMPAGSSHDSSCSRSFSVPFLFLFRKTFYLGDRALFCSWIKRQVDGGSKIGFFFGNDNIRQIYKATQGLFYD